MSKKSRNTRREFMEGTLFAGLAFMFAKAARRAQGAEPNDTVLPLVTTRIAQPDNGVCAWAGFSPVNDQVAFVSGLADKTSLYVSRLGQPDSFDVLWASATDTCAIRACAWSPNGQEIAFLVQQVNTEAVPKTSRVSIFVADVASKAVREPVVISETVGSENRQMVNVSFKKGLAWWTNSSVCVPADKTQTAGVLKFDTHTGQSETLIPAKEDTVISNVALTRSGELRFVKVKGLQQGGSKQVLLCGLAQDGTTRDYADLTQQFGAFLDARLSQDGEFVFIEKNDAPSQPTLAIPVQSKIIYKVQTGSIIGKIPYVVSYKGDMYAYMPLIVQNDKDLILIEMVTLTADGGTTKKAPLIRVVKLTLS